MKKLLVLALTAGAIGSAMAQTGVNLSIGVNQPGVYGQINIGHLPPPALVAPRPVVIIPGAVSAPPSYLYVPVAQRQRWHRYCHRYDACGRPVYFVREQWVRERYAHEHPDWNRRHAPRGHADGRHDERQGDRRDDRRGHDRRD